MIDFDALLLGPLQDVFGEAIVVYPLVSLPGADQYPARGDFRTTPFDVIQQDGTIFSDQKTELAIRPSEFEVPPVVDDQIFVVRLNTLYVIADGDDDGSGETLFLLRKVVPT